ncbi:hypothetical protein B0H14DRAFT_3474161 [Mycena olivaceomarginata]|nr:hypothetical protein B0H14DRAFT_3474161 [Mycena olivaceomarginata]
MQDSGLGCAQDANGELLDASRIQWYNDVDDEHPIQDASSSSASTSAIPPSYFLRCSPSCQSRGLSTFLSSPSLLSHFETVGSSGKRRADDTSPGPRKPRKKAQVIVSESSDSESDGAEASEPVADVDAETEGEHTDAASAMDIDRDEYQKFKAMGDADHEHATAKASRTDSTADIKTVFRRIKGEKDAAITQAAGNICLVCTRKGLKPAAILGHLSA